VVNFSPTSPQDLDIPDGAILGAVTSQDTLGILSNACAISGQLNFTFMEGTTDITNTVEPYAWGPTSPRGSNDLAGIAGDTSPSPDGVQDIKPPPAVAQYPSYLNAIFDPDWVDFGPDLIAGNADDTNGPLPPIKPRFRSVGVASIAFAANLWVVLQEVVFEPGTDLPNLPPFDPSLGYPSVTVLQQASAAGSATPPAPSAITDFCTPLKADTLSFGVTQDNPDTPANEAGIPVRTLPGAGTPVASTFFGFSQRDADGDGYENSLDPCPFHFNDVWDARKQDTQGDTDTFTNQPFRDGIPDTCDPTTPATCTPGIPNLLTPDPSDFICDPANTASGSPPANQPTDHDGDGFPNRGDNCPTAYNPDQADNDVNEAGEVVGDGIGDACDTPGSDGGTDCAGPNCTGWQPLPIPARTVSGNGPGLPDGGQIQCIQLGSITVGGDPNVAFSDCQGGPPPPPPPGPPNDNFANAIAIGALPFTDSQSTEGATFESGEPGACAPVGATVWFAFTPGEDMRIAADTFGSDFDTVLAAYTGTSLFSLIPVACNDQFQSNQSKIIFSATAGTTYYFQAGGYFGQTGNLVFSAEVGPPPLEIAVSIAPTGSVSPQGGTATVHGTVTCSKPAFVELSGELSQQAGRASVFGFLSALLPCTGEASWQATVEGENGRFAGGRADLSVSAFASAEGEFDFAEASGPVLLKGTRPPRPAGCPRAGNDGFEAGVVDTNAIPCWTVVDQQGGSGSWCNQAGAAPPQGDCGVGSFATVAVPPEGLEAAMTNQDGPGSHVLYRCGVLRSGTISFQLQLNNQAFSFFSQPSLGFDVFPNQQFRADLVTAAGIAADPFTVAPADLLLTLYQTQPGDPAVSGYGRVAMDASAFVGEDVCLRFAEVDNQSYFNVGIDDVQIDLRSRGR